MTPWILPLMVLSILQHAHRAAPDDLNGFEGTWRLVYDNRQPEYSEVGLGWLMVKNGVWTMIEDGKLRNVSVQFETAEPWPAIRRSVHMTARAPDDRGGGLAGNVSFTMKGIYRLEGDTLIFALVSTYPDGRPLPDSFQPKEDVAIEVWRREPIDAPPPPTPIDLKPFEGEWTLVYTNHEPVPDYIDAKARRLTVEDGVWSERWDGQLKPMRVQFKRTSLRPMIERKIKLDDEPPGGGDDDDEFDPFNTLTWNQKGIYRFEGDTLVFALAGAGRPLPVTFEPKEGVVIEVWTRDPRP